MANKTRATSDDVQVFLEAVPAARRRDDCLALADLIEKVTGVEPVMWGSSIVGFGSHHYVYESGREGDQPRVAFSPRAKAIVFYGLLSGEGARTKLDALGAHELGKGCLYVKTLADVDLSVLSDLVTSAFLAKQPASDD